MGVGNHSGFSLVTPLAHPYLYVLIIFFSAAKAPFLARFKARHCGVNELERVALECYQNAERNGTSTEADLQTISRGDEMSIGWTGAIFKVSSQRFVIFMISSHSGGR